MESKYLTRSRDVDTYLLSQLDDKELFEILLLNKDFLKLGSAFFEKRLKERYPLLLKFKPEKMNYTKYYLSVVYYIAELKEEYDIDYVPAPSFNPKIFYYKLVNNYASLDEYYGYIGETGDMKLIKEYEDVLDTDSLFAGVILSGNLDAVKYLENKGQAIDELRYLSLAVLSQNEDMENYIFTKLVPLFDEGEINLEMVYATSALDNLNVVKYFDRMMEPNTHYQQILGIISNLDIFKYFVKKFEIEIENEEMDLGDLHIELSDATYYGVTKNRLEILRYIGTTYPHVLSDMRKYATLFHSDDVLNLLDEFTKV